MLMALKGILLAGTQRLVRKNLKKMEARVGIEPTYKGFADLSLTTWVPRHSQIVVRSVTLAADEVILIR